MAEQETPPRISVCIVCRNESDKLVACLESVSWADEIVVMDLGSEDGPADVARARNAIVLEHEPFPIVEPLRNEIAAVASGEWILVLDPDERISPGLARELQGMRYRTDVDAVVMPRLNIDFGHEPTHRNQRYEPQLRMYRRSRVKWPAEPNKLPRVPANRLLRLPDADTNVIIHHRNESVAEALERVIRYAPAEAQAMIERGQTFSAQAMLSDLAKRGHRYFVDSKAFDEGVPGVARAGVLLGFHFYVWIAFWHMSGAARTADDDSYLRRIGRLTVAAGSVARAAKGPGRAAKRVARRLR